jgi:hypothetical protein
MNDINNDLVIVRISKTKLGKVVPQKKRASKGRQKKMIGKHNLCKYHLTYFDSFCIMLIRQMEDLNVGTVMQSFLFCVFSYLSVTASSPETRLHQEILRISEGQKRF